MKKILFTLLSFVLCISICNAEVTTYDRNELENYGVNKKWNIGSHNLNNVMSTHAVDASEKIYDFSDILSEADEYSLKQLIDDFYETTGFELVILTESFYNLDDDDNGDYAQDFYDYNDFGLEDEYYSGVIILRNTYPGLPYYGVYSFGEAQYYYPAEYDDNRLNTTLDYVYDDMVAGNYKRAMAKIINDLTDYYEDGKEYGMDDYELDEDGMLVYVPSPPTFYPPIIFALVVSVIITWIFISSNVKKNKTVFLPRLAHDYLEENGIVFTNKSDILYDSRTTSYTVSSSSGYSGRSGGGGGGRSYSSSRGSSGGGRSGGGRRG